MLSTMSDTFDWMNPSCFHAFLVGLELFRELVHLIFQFHCLAIHLSLKIGCNLLN